MLAHPLQYVVRKDQPQSGRSCCSCLVKDGNALIVLKIMYKLLKQYMPESDTHQRSSTVVRRPATALRVSLDGHQTTSKGHRPSPDSHQPSPDSHQPSSDCHHTAITGSSTVLSHHYTVLSRHQASLRQSSAVPILPSQAHQMIVRLTSEGLETLINRPRLSLEGPQTILRRSSVLFRRPSAALSGPQRPSAALSGPQRSSDRPQPSAVSRRSPNTHQTAIQLKAGCHLHASSQSIALV